MAHLFEKLCIKDIDVTSKAIQLKRIQRIDLLKNWNDVEHINFFEIDGGLKRKIEESLDKLPKKENTQKQNQIKVKKSLGKNKFKNISSRQNIRFQSDDENEKLPTIETIEGRRNSTNLNFEKSFMNKTRQSVDNVRNQNILSLNETKTFQINRKMNNNFKENGKKHETIDDFNETRKNFSSKLLPESGKIGENFRRNYKGKTLVTSSYASRLSYNAGLKIYQKIPLNSVYLNKFSQQNCK